MTVWAASDTSDAEPGLRPACVHASEKGLPPAWLFQARQFLVRRRAGEGSEHWGRGLGPPRTMIGDFLISLGASMLAITLTASPQCSSLSAVMPDFRYRQATVTLDVCGFAFRAAGGQPIELGWRAASPDWQPDAEKSDEEHLLPTLCDNERVQLKGPSVERKEARAPVPCNEGTLSGCLQN